MNAMATCLVSNSFRLEQSEGSIESDPLLAILSGSSPAYLVKHVVSKTECDQIWQNFQRLSAQRRHDDTTTCPEFTSEVFITARPLTNTSTKWKKIYPVPPN